MIGKNRRLQNRMEKETRETLPLLEMLGGFAGDSLKALLDWKKPDDMEWSEFLMSKLGALVLVLIAIAGIAVIAGYFLLKYQHLASG
jgi:hypothetical protein